MLSTWKALNVRFDNRIDCNGGQVGPSCDTAELHTFAESHMTLLSLLFCLFSILLLC